MIGKKQRHKKELFATLDIETGPAGELLAIATYDGDDINHFLSWDELFSFLELNNSKPQYRKLFAHNGGGFDWVHMLEDQIDNLMDMKIIMSGSGIIFIQLNMFEKKVVFADSILTLQKGLAPLCDVFKPDIEKLKDFDIERIKEIFENDIDLFYRYLDNDVISLFQIMQKFMTLMDLEKFPLTAASLAMMIFRERFIPEDVKLFKSGLKPNNKIDQFIAQSYAGGRVECFRPGIYDDIHVYDINSLYPYVMTEAKIPDCIPIETASYVKGVCGFYKVEFKQWNEKLPPVLWKKHKTQGLVFCYEGEGIFSHIEIENAQRVGCRISVKFGYLYPRTKKIFANYVNHHYKLRKSNSGSALDHICKLLLNGLYGKFGQKEESNHLERIDGETLKQYLADGVDVVPYDEKRGLFIIGEDRKIEHRIIFVASIITAMARTEIYRYIEANVDHLIYCDTDSVHLTNTMTTNIGPELGKMKLEYNGKGVYIGRKMYGVGDNIKFKGVTTKGKLGHDYIGLDTLERIAKGDNVNFSFNTFPKLKTVLRGKAKAAKKVEIKKVLKNPVYTTNFLKKNVDRI